METSQFRGVIPPWSSPFPRRRPRSRGLRPLDQPYDRGRRRSAYSSSAQAARWRFDRRAALSCAARGGRHRQRPRAGARGHHRHGDHARGRPGEAARRASASTPSSPRRPSTRSAARKEVERHFAPFASTPTFPCSQRRPSVCVHTKLLDPTMLVRLGQDGVASGRERFLRRRRELPLAHARERGRGTPPAASDRS